MDSVALANIIIYDQKLSTGNADYSLVIPQSVFIQQRRGVYGLAYNATLVDGSPIPEWLFFDDENIKLQAVFVTRDGWKNFTNATDQEEWLADMDVKVAATDALGASVSIQIPFQLNWRTPPAVVVPTPDVSLPWGASEEYTISDTSFLGFQPGYTLKYDVDFMRVTTCFICSLCNGSMRCHPSLCQGPTLSCFD